MNAYVTVIIVRWHLGTHDPNKHREVEYWKRLTSSDLRHDNFVSSRFGVARVLPHYAWGLP